MSATLTTHIVSALGLDYASDGMEQIDASSASIDNRLRSSGCHRESRLGKIFPISGSEQIALFSLAADELSPLLTS